MSRTNFDQLLQAGCHFGKSTAYVTAKDSIS